MLMGAQEVEMTMLWPIRTAFAVLGRVAPGLRRAGRSISSSHRAVDAARSE
jgi:hypothetical protein